MQIRGNWTPVIATALLAFLILLPAAVSRSAETLPAQLSDSDYWQMIFGFSEPSGYFQYEIITSNEVSYQQVLPGLMRTPRTGGAYLGVGPEQNFTYIAALKPKIAFIFDIRRDMMLEHLMYKSIFEMSADRVEFVSNLFSRKAPAQLTAGSPIETIFRTFTGAPVDPALVEQHTKGILDRLKTRHHFPLTAGDERGIRTIYRNFAREGVLSFDSSFRSPGYAALMTLTDGAGKNWSYLAARENYDRIRAMHQANLIVPIVGDFAGPKAIRAVAQYLKEHGAVVHAFYISNVEDYIRAWGQYVANISSLPMDPSSVLIRWTTAGFTSLSSMTDFVRSQRIFR
ncbi:MAG TPA: hypothetical protein VGK48_05340 [Terriglobia bacterium]|jgi:hypothetical protein